jgi:hypothetical protein
VAEQVNAFFAHYAAVVLAWLGSPDRDLEAARRALHRSLVLQIEGLAPRAAPSRTRPQRAARAPHEENDR